MAKIFIFMVVLVNFHMLQGERPYTKEQRPDHQLSHQKSPTYSFSYGVSDGSTGDIKSVSKFKQGDTVKGHYSVLEPSGSVRTVEYSAGPKTGFTADVNNDNNQITEVIDHSLLQEKSSRNYENLFDFSEDANIHSYASIKKRKQIPEDYNDYEEFPYRHRPKFDSELETSDFTHSYTIKHPYDMSASESEPYSHLEFDFEPNCKKKEEKKLYTNILDQELGKKKYPFRTANPNKYFEEYEKYVDTPLLYKDKPVNHVKSKNKLKNHKVPLKTDLSNFKGQRLPLESEISEVSAPENYYDSDYHRRPNIKHKPYKTPLSDSQYRNEDLDDYILVPKKKYKTSFSDLNVHDDFLSNKEKEFNRPYYGHEEEYNRARFPSSMEDNIEDDRPYRPPRDLPTKEIIRKVVKKRKPVINLLEIFDI